MAIHFGICPHGCGHHLLVDERHCAHSLRLPYGYTYGKEPCGGCYKPIWYRLSASFPQAWTPDEFKKQGVYAYPAGEAVYPVEQKAPPPPLKPRSRSSKKRRRVPTVTVDYPTSAGRGLSYLMGAHLVDCPIDIESLGDGERCDPEFESFLSMPLAEMKKLHLNNRRAGKFEAHWPID